jgi:Uma2 family endonuclease
MAMPFTPPARRYRVADVLAYPADGNRYEVVDGELLVTPSPAWRHQLLVSRLMARLLRYLEPLGLADTLITSPADITWGQDPRDAEDLVQPDVFVIQRPGAIGSWRDVQALDLAVEIVSPGSSYADRVVKRKTYQRHHVTTYWVVDPEARLVEVWGPEDDRPGIATDVLTWRHAEATGDLTIGLQDLFAELDPGVPPAAGTADSP